MKIDVIIAFVDEVMNQYVYNSNKNSDWLDLGEEKKKEWFRNFYDNYIGVKREIKNDIKENTDLSKDAHTGFNKDSFYEIIEELYSINDTYYSICASIEDINNSKRISSEINMEASYDSNVPNITKIKIDKDTALLVLKMLDEKYTDRIRVLISKAKIIIGD